MTKTYNRRDKDQAFSGEGGVLAVECQFLQGIGVDDDEVVELHQRFHLVHSDRIFDVQRLVSCRATCNQLNRTVQHQCAVHQYCG